LSIGHDLRVLLVLFAIFVFAVVAYVYWDRMRELPPGAPRWLWLAAVWALGGAMAATGSGIPGPLIAAAWLVTLGLIALASRARDRAERST
jgi:hypothetical protein